MTRTLDHGLGTDRQQPIPKPPWDSPGWVPDPVGHQPGSADELDDAVPDSLASVDDSPDLIATDETEPAALERPPRQSRLERRWVYTVLAVLILLGLGIGAAGAVFMTQAASTADEVSAVAAERADVEADAASLARQIEERQSVADEAQTDAQQVREATADVVAAADEVLVALDASVEAQIAMVEKYIASTEAWNRGESGVARSIVRDEIFPAVEELRATLKTSASALRAFRDAIAALEEVVA